MKKRVLIISVALFLCVSIAGSFAFLTARTEKKTNQFTVGNIEIELTEPKWSELPDANQNGIPDEAECISPLQVIPKDPMITNTGTNPAYVYLKISVPKKNVLYANETGQIVEKSDTPTEIFSYTANQGWTQFACDTSGESQNDYYYYYNKILNPGESTNSLFNSIKYADIIEGQLEGEKCMVDVMAFGVQTEGSGITDAASAWNVLSAEKNLNIKATTKETP